MITFGSDPEAFILYNAAITTPQKLLEQEVIRADEINGIYYIKHGDVSIHFDGATIEFVLPPSGNLQALQKVYLEEVKNIEKEYPIYIINVPAAYISEYEYPTAEDLRFQVEFAGCNPDFDPILEETGIISLPETTGGLFKFRDRWRFGGGHIHVSVPDIFKRLKIREEHRKLSIIFAIVVGTTFVTLAQENLINLEKRRVKVYGTPAKYRPQKVEETGIFEYRMPSNEWLTWDVNRINKLQESIEVALDLFFNNFTPQRELVYLAAESILEFDKEKARQVLENIK